MILFTKLLSASILIIQNVHSIELPGSCNNDQYYDTSVLVCLPCPANSSMTASTDGFACSCVSHSVPMSVSRCKPCNATDMVSSDGRSCVPRRCQNNNGKVVCRKCPGDYISVTQNLDGSPMKEVQCIKCARGYKADAKLNVCVRCDHCACATHEEPLAGACVPKRFVNERGKGDKNVVKLEYLCMQGDVRACRALANQCVTSFYSIDLSGPCRLWLLPKTTTPKGLPQLNIDLGSGEKKPGEINLNRGMNASLSLAVAIHDGDGGVEILQDPSERGLACQLPIQFTIGDDFSKDCSVNITSLDARATMAAYLTVDDNVIPLPATLRKPDGHYVQRGTWPNSKFRRYFLRHQAPSSIPNITSTVYLRTLIVKVQVQRENYKSSLRLLVSIEAQYATKSSSQMITTSLEVEHELPSAGVLRGLEVWGGVLGALLSLHAILVWRTTVRRGGMYANMAPFAHAIATALYVAALFSTLHALGAEAGSLGMTLPLSRSEEHMVKAFVYSAIGLMAVKIIFINLNQIKCDIFFLDWSEYNPPMKETNPMINKTSSWRALALGREWSAMQTKRRACPGYTGTLALLILHLMQPWQNHLPHSQSYRWSLAALAWWSAYTVVLLSRWLRDRLFGSPTEVLPMTCRGVGMSLMVFQEDLYAHYVDGRNEDSDTKTLSGSLTNCRVVCAPQLRAVYKQLNAATLAGLQGEMKQALLSRFLAAFFERALDGLSWVASERTLVEKLFDLEVVTRESGTTSALLYDSQGPPSCFNVTWWGQEWSLGLFDAMLFSAVVMAGHDSLLAAFVTLAVWQGMKISRQWLGNRSLRERTGVDIKLN